MVIAGAPPAAAPGDSQVDFVVAKLLADGTFDPTFGDRGVVRTDFGQVDVPSQLVVQPDGRIVVAGTSDNEDLSNRQVQWALARYTADGTLDPGFGGDGTVTTALSDHPHDASRLSAVMLDTSGRIIAAGAHQPRDSWDVALARYGPDGTLDATFGDNGLVLSGSDEEAESAEFLTIDEAGRLLTVGSWLDVGRQLHSNAGLVLTRHHPDGSIDLTFGSQGRVTVPAPESTTIFPGGIAARPDGPAVAATLASSEDSWDGYHVSADALLLAFHPDGRPDRTFGDRGRVVVDEGYTDTFDDLDVDAAGRLVTVGQTVPVLDFPDYVEITFRRYSPTGLPDPTMGVCGRARLLSDDIGGGIHETYRMSTPNEEAWHLAGRGEVLRYRMEQHGSNLRRLCGLDRYATGAQVALHDDPQPGTIDTVYLATGENFADALAGGSLASDNRRLLMTAPDHLPDATSMALNQLRPTNVVALGGPVAVSEDVLATAATAAGGATTSRISGPTRYATAAAVADRIGATGTVYLATGVNFPDALSGAPAAAGHPILLTSELLPAETRAALRRLDPSEVVVLGGPTAVPSSVIDEVARLLPEVTPRRLQGPDRYATAVAAAQTLPDPKTVFVASGEAFPDALAGGAVAAANGIPVVLVARDHLPDATRDYLRTLSDLEQVILLGGPVAVTDTVANQVGP